MSKRDKKINVIKKYISNAGKNWPTFSYGNIPSQRAINACSAYAGAVNPSDILGMIDTTAFGNGKTGMVFTEYKVYYDFGMFGEKGSVSYQKVYDSGKIPGGVFDSSCNRQALIELISMLANIEGENLADNINSALDQADSTARSIGDTINKAKSFLDDISSLFN